MKKEKIAVLVALMEDAAQELAHFANLISERDATISQAGLSVLTKDERAAITGAENAVTVAREFLEML